MLQECVHIEKKSQIYLLQLFFFSQNITALFSKSLFFPQQWLKYSRLPKLYYIKEEKKIIKSN